MSVLDGLSGATDTGLLRGYSWTVSLEANGTCQWASQTSASGQGKPVMEMKPQD